MIKVFAFEPEAICDPKLAQALESFGFEHGRLIGCVPRDWRRQIGDLYRLKFPQDKELDIALERLAKKRAIQRVRLPEMECDSWMQSACAVERDFLHGIICAKASLDGESDPRVIGRSDIHDDNPIWKQETGVREFRDSKAMAEKVRILLRYSAVVKFIDPHFSGENRHTDFVVECIKGLDTWNSAKRPQLEIHFHFTPLPGEDLETRKNRSMPVFETILGKTKDALSKQKVDLTLHQWSMVDDGDRFHERFVVTDCGSIEFGGGLDSERRNEKTCEKTSVKLMSSSVKEDLQKAYSITSGIYDLLHHAALPNS